MTSVSSQPYQQRKESDSDDYFSSSRAVTKTSQSQAQDQLQSDLDNLALHPSKSTSKEEEAKLKKTQQLIMLEKRLELISVGGESEQLAHEICLNPNYKLPDSQSTDFIDTLVGNGFDFCPDGLVRPKQPTTAEETQSQSNHVLMANSMKRLVLDVMADRMICAIRPSVVNDIKDIAVGARVAVTLPEQPTALIFMTAVVDSVDDKSLTLSVTYMCTKKKEVDVSFNRIKQSHHGIDLSQFFAAFGDLHTKISSFSKNHEMEPVDYELLVLIHA